MKKILLGSQLLVLASIAAAQGKLTDVQWTKVGDGLKVEVTGENLTQPKILRVMGGKSYMLEFDAHLIGKPKRQTINYGGVQYLQSGWFSAKPAKVRVHLRLNDPESAVKVDQTDTGWTVSVNAQNAVVADLSKAPTGTEPVVRVASLALPTLPSVSAILGETTAPDGFPDEVKKKKPHADHNTKPNVDTKVIPATKIVPIPMPETPASQTRGNGGRYVSLDMVNADIVQILKALAMQGGVNIITSPEVHGNLTVSLEKVTVEEALNLVTTLAGVKYAKSGATYVVAASAERLKSFPRLSDNAETRVVPIYSGEGNQIKAAVLKVTPMDGSNGGFEIVLPSEDISVEQTTANQQTTGDKGQSGTGEATKVETKTNKDANVKDNYVVLIGPKSRLDNLERTVRAIDSQICGALGLNVPSSNMLVRQTYSPHGTSAVKLLQTVAGAAWDQKSPNSARIGNVELLATPEQTIGEQAITLKGRESEVAELIEVMKSLDTVNGGAGENLLYEVKNLDPRSLREDLVANFPGLQVTILPAAASNPALANDKSQYKQTAEYKGQNEQQKQSNNSGGGQGGDQGGQQGGGAGGNAEMLAPDKGEVSGIALPFSKFEQSAFPMRIMLRGNKDKIDEALAYLKTIDTAPKQVAIELRVMDLRKEDAQRVGLDWSILTGGSVQNVRVNQGFGDAPSTAGTISGALGFKGGGLVNILSTLDAMANNTNLIARPNLLGVDGRQSELFVGDIIRYVESIQSTQNGVTITTKELPVGVRLAILPRIGGDGQITMDLRPVVSSLTNFIDVPGGGKLPQTSLRVAQSTMIMKSGETIAIGGLIQNSDTFTNSGVPFLKDLPLIGKLFQRTDKLHKKSEIVFFLTAKIVDDNNRADAAAPKAEAAPDKSKKSG